MKMTPIELWTALHGMVFGALFLLAFAGGLAGLYGLRREWLTTAGIKDDVRRLVAGTWIMAILAWLTVIIGTWIVYVPYRAEPPAGVDLTNQAELTQFPRYFLLASHDTALWHEFGMEWKEHIAWISPMLATAVAFVVLYYGLEIAERPYLRRALIVLFTLSFVAAGIAGLFGAFITKAAPLI
jgi:hypothetical protein